MARQPIGHESAVTRPVAAAGSRLVGVLPAGRAAARDLRAGRMDTTAHTEVLLAALAQRKGTPAGTTPVGHWGTAVEICSGTPRRMAHGGERTDADSVVECDVAAVRVRDAIGSCGERLSRQVQPPDTENRMSGGVGGWRGLASPSPDPIGSSEILAGVVYFRAVYFVSGHSGAGYSGAGHSYPAYRGWVRLAGACRWMLL